MWTAARLAILRSHLDEIHRKLGGTLPTGHKRFVVRAEGDIVCGGGRLRRGRAEQLGDSARADYDKAVPDSGKANRRATVADDHALVLRRLCAQSIVKATQKTARHGI